VKVYSNCDSVELWLNDRSMGSKRGEDCVFVWNVTLKDGENRVKAVGEREGKRCEDACEWRAAAGAATRVGVR